ncbi:hypothetical protein COO60DRAFT_551533 [Scenedesmus sp. NREL 46B-D3]|nr:hypothetical protein COO60DRAFT_551533 [Scenedesmus sp. NREL 46B-D3]
MAAANRQILEQLLNDLHQALCPVLLNQPDNPLLFLCSHFRDQAGITSSPVSAAYRTLRLSSSEGKHCNRNMMSAYKTLSEAGGHMESSVFLQLLSMLTGSLPSNLAATLMQLFTVLCRLPPSFAVFHNATKSCMLLEELCRQPQQGAGGFMFQLPEAKKLLQELLMEEDWLQSMEPMQQITRLRAVRLQQSSSSQTAAAAGGVGSGAALLDVRLAEEAAMQQVEQLVAMALAARAGS